MWSGAVLPAQARILRPFWRVSLSCCMPAGPHFRTGRLQTHCKEQNAKRRIEEVIAASRRFRYFDLWSLILDLTCSPIQNPRFHCFIPGVTRRCALLTLRNFVTEGVTGALLE